MNICRVSFIGHRIIYTDIEHQLEEAVRELASTFDFVEFYVGKNGDFDTSAASAVKRIQNAFGKERISLTLVLPYNMKDESLFFDFYDEVIIPVSPKTHFKKAITERNQWMVSNTDILIAYVNKESGGAYKALKYAEMMNKKIINLATAAQNHLI